MTSLVLFSKMNFTIREPQVSTLHTNSSKEDIDIIQEILKNRTVGNLFNSTLDQYTKTINSLDSDEVILHYTLDSHRASVIVHTKDETIIRFVNVKERDIINSIAKIRSSIENLKIDSMIFIYKEKKLNFLLLILITPFDGGSIVTSAMATTKRYLFVVALTSSIRGNAAKSSPHVGGKNAGARRRVNRSHVKRGAQLHNRLNP